jgi:hypothetical protein
MNHMQRSSDDSRLVSIDKRKELIDPPNKDKYSIISEDRGGSSRKIVISNKHEDDETKKLESTVVNS